jgi:hypothetical protein
MMDFLRRDAGLVTVEWVGIGAVMVLATIAITSYVMQGTEGAGGSVAKGLQSVDASEPVVGVFGDGLATSLK